MVDHLAEQVGVTQQFISKLENGEFSNVLTLERVLLFLGYTVQIKAVRLEEKVARRIAQAIRNHPGRIIRPTGLRWEFLSKDFSDKKLLGQLVLFLWIEFCEFVD